MDTRLWKWTFVRTAGFYTQHTQNILYAKAGHGRSLLQKLLPSVLTNKERATKQRCESWRIIQSFINPSTCFLFSRMHRRVWSHSSIWVTADELNVPLFCYFFVFLSQDNLVVCNKQVSFLGNFSIVRVEKGLTSGVLSEERLSVMDSGWENQCWDVGWSPAGTGTLLSHNWK